MKKPIVIIVIVVVIVLGGAGTYALTHRATKTTTASNTTPTPTSTDTNTATNTITYADSGFSPSNLTVKSGTTVTIKNTSSQTMQFDSDPHPVHTNDTDLNAGSIAAGKSTTFVADKMGTFGYHNHLDPGQTGTIIVQ
jgi:plastocyanin